MPSSNIRAARMPRANAKAPDDNPSILHRPRTVYVGKEQYPINLESASFVGLHTTPALVNSPLKQIARNKNDHF